ncbi:MAG: toll/interleukin-1 receptor domain-containing protein [Clostridiales bacterium]|nr:toll/interleukin-1 receptor domain-containing protein [Clostridiales bacterium]
MTEEKILAGNFVFVSYSHLDTEIVEEDVLALQKLGVRVWFDANMRVGDNWQEIAREKLSHANCKGVLFYNSKNSYISKAVHLERQIVKERLASDDKLGYWSVNIDGKSCTDIFIEAIKKATESSPERIPTLTKEFRELFDELFQDEKICVMRVSSQDYIEKIYQEIARPYMLVDDVGLVVGELEKAGIISRDTGCIKFGRYIDKQCPLPLPHGEGNGQIVTKTDEVYIYKDGQNYTTRPLLWKLLYVEDDRAVLLCSEIVEASCGGASVNPILADFKQMAFSKEQQELLLDGPRLMTEADIEKNQNPHSLSLYPAPDPYRSHWWIDGKGLLDKWQKTYCDGKEHKKGFVISVKKGVRPVIAVHKDKLVSIKEC